MPGFDTGSVMYALNVDFTGTSLTAGTAQVTTNGQLLIGSTSLPNIQVGTLTSPLGTIAIGYSSPNITLDITGGATAIEKVNLQSGTSPIVPASGAITFNGATVGAGTNPVRTDGTGPNTMALQVQIAQAIASTNATNIGLAAFNSAQFTVDSNGFVSTSGTGVMITLTGNTGGAISPVAGNINTVGTGSITIAGTGNTLTTQLTGLTNHAVLVGAGTATITNVGPTSTSGQILQSQGSTTDPAFSTATYPSTTTINQILYSSAANVVSGLATGNNGVLITSATGVPSLLPNGVTGQVFTATTGSPPSWQSAPASSITFTGDAGTPFTTSSVTIDAGNAAVTCGSSVLFTAASPNLNLTLSDSSQSTFLGGLAGNLTHSGGANTGVGYTCLSSLTGGIENTCTGWFCGGALTTGSSNTSSGFKALASCSTGGLNVAVGLQALAMCAASGNTAVGYEAAYNLASGQFNVAIGINSLLDVTSGSYNTCLGASAGSGATSGDSSNIYIANIGPGSESNAIRIGTPGSGGAGTQTTCYIAGIEGVSVSNLNYVTINTATGQLGSVASIPSISNYTNVNHAASPYTVLTTDFYISVDCSGGAVTLNFPNAPTFKQQWIVKDRTGNASTNNITLTTPGGTVTFDGSTSYIMTSNYSAINILANATPTYEIF